MLGRTTLVIVLSLSLRPSAAAWLLPRKHPVAEQRPAVHVQPTLAPPKGGRVSTSAPPEARTSAPRQPTSERPHLALAIFGIGGAIAGGGVAGGFVGVLVGSALLWFVASFTGACVERLKEVMAQEVALEYMTRAAKRPHDAAASCSAFAALPAGSKRRRSS